MADKIKEMYASCVIDKEAIEMARDRPEYFMKYITTRMTLANKQLLEQRQEIGFGDGTGKLGEDLYDKPKTQED